MKSQNIEAWIADKKVFVQIEDCISVSANKTQFFVKFKNNLSGEISLGSLQLILENKPEIIDEKSLDLKKMREFLKTLFEQQF